MGKTRRNSDEGSRNGPRTFLALGVDEPTRRRLAEGASRLRELLPSVRWVKSEGMHLTFRFLGTTPPAVVQALPHRLVHAVQRCAPFRAPLLGLGLLPERGRPRVLMLRIELPESGLELQRECEIAVQGVGFPPEGRPFRPHLTLGRFPKPVSRPSLPEQDWGVAEFSELLFFESQLGPGGAVYRPLRRFALGRA